LIYQGPVKLIKERKNIAILSHVMPDGDNIGSCLALYNALIKLGKNVVIIQDDDVPEIYKFLKSADKVVKPGGDYSIDLVIALDCGDISRLGKSAKYLENKDIINIDHHISNTKFGHHNIIDTNASATAELVYELINKLEIILDKDICECIYTGIVTDTGQFQYSNTTSVTHQIAANLINNGVEPAKVYKALYQNNSISKMKLIGKALSLMEFHYDNKIASIMLSKEDFESLGAKDEDTDGLINYARDIKGVEVALLFKETYERKIKIGFRSKDYIDVSKIAQKYGGGGHIRAAGATVDGELNDIKEKIVEDVINVF